MLRPFYGGGIKTTALSVKYHIKNDITNIKMPLRWPFLRLNNFISIWHRIICNSNSKCSTLHHQLSSLFVTEAVFGLRESTLLNTITVKMSVLLGCQHGVYAMSFAASVTSYYIHYVIKCFTSVFICEHYTGIPRTPELRHHKHMNGSCAVNYNFCDLFQVSSINLTF